MRFCAFLILWIPALALAQYPPIHLSPDSEGRATKPIRVGATLLRDNSGLYQISLSGTMKKVQRVTVNFSMYAVAKDSDAKSTDSSRILYVPVKTHEENGRTKDEAGTWRASLNISPQLAKDARIMVYVEYVGMATDTGDLYQIDVADFLPRDHPSSQPSSQGSR